MKLRLTVLAILLGALCAQEPPPSAAPPVASVDQKDLGRIEGRTVNMAGQPLRKTNLTLRHVDASAGETPKPPYGAVSDAEGKFSFDAIEPGGYQLMAERQGYLRQAYGAKPGVMQGTQLTVSAGQQMKDITLQLAPQAVITGKILDEDGDPVGRVQVRVMRPGFSNGKRQLLPAGGGMSDDSGEFKLTGLAPGRYHISVVPGRPNMFGDPVVRRATSPSDKPEQDYVTTYYPGVTDIAAASPIEVAVGRNLSGIDITLRKSAVFRVRGKVTGSIPNQPTQQLRVMVMPRDGFFGFMGLNGAGIIAKDGSFELTGVQPGSYTLVAVSTNGNMEMLARQPLEITNGNTEGVVLTLQPLGELHGTVKIEGETKASDPTRQNNAAQTLNVRVMLMSMDGIGFNQANSLTNNDGTFTLSKVSPGKYRMNVYGTPKGTYLKSVLLENQDVLATGLDLSQGAGGNNIQVILSPAAGQIDGTIQTDQQQSTQGSIVTLIPDPPQPEQNYLYRMTTADQSGRFSLKDLAPGKYRLYAWEQLDNGAQYDPDFIKSHESEGVLVKLTDSGHEQVTVTRIASTRLTEANQSK